jgi:hypothetical protein
MNIKNLTTYLTIQSLLPQPSMTREQLTENLSPEGFITDYQKKILLETFGSYVRDQEVVEGYLRSGIPEYLGYDAFRSNTFASFIDDIVECRIDLELIGQIRKQIDGGIHLDLFANNLHHPTGLLGTPTTIL